MELATVTFVIALIVISSKNILGNDTTAMIAQPNDAPNDVTCDVCPYEYQLEPCNYDDRKPFQLCRYRRF